MSKTNNDRLREELITDFLSGRKERLRRSNTLVFIPVHNEEDTIAEVVQAIRDACDYDILIIDDASTDTTPEIISGLDAEILTHKEILNSRIINGLEIGNISEYRYLIKIDGDGQHNASDILRLREYADTNDMDLVIGSRHLNGFKANICSIKGAGMWFCSALVSVLGRQRITDSTSGIKIWSRRASELAVKSYKRGKLQEGSTFHIEELIIAAKHGLRIAEIDIIINPRQYGESKSFSTANLIKFPFNLLKTTFRAIF
ncbi:glycosyltransferase family 2 protein [Chloroflexota bacterium]